MHWDVRSTRETHLIRLIGEVNFVVDLCRLVLDRLHLHVMGRMLPLAPPCRSLEPLQAVHGNGVASAVDELSEVLEQGLAAVEEAGGQPHQLPAALLAWPHWVLCQLLHDLAVDLVTQDLL